MCSCGLGRAIVCSLVLVTHFLAVQNWFRVRLWSMLSTAKYRINIVVKGNGKRTLCLEYRDNFLGLDVRMKVVKVGDVKQRDFIFHLIFSIPSATWSGWLLIKRIIFHFLIEWSVFLQDICLKSWNSLSLLTPSSSWLDFFRHRMTEGYNAGVWSLTLKSVASSPLFW